MQLEAERERPGALAGHQNDRGLDGARARIADQHAKHDDRRGPAPGARPRLSLAVAQLGDPMRARDGLRDHARGLGGQREPA